MNERFELIKPYIEGKDVVDIGFCDWCDQLAEKNICNEIPKNWVHNKILKHAKTVLGIDISKKCIEFLRGKGYEVELSNAEDFNLDHKVDVIVAGELIEHLSNIQGFLNCSKKNLKENGLLILTTPNLFYIRQILLLMLRGYPAVHPEHVCWFDEITLRQLLDRHGFSVVKLLYITERYEYNSIHERLKEMPFLLFETLIPFKKIKYATIIIIAQSKEVT